MYLNSRDTQRPSRLQKESFVEGGGGGQEDSSLLITVGQNFKIQRGKKEQFTDTGNLSVYIMLGTYLDVHSLI